MIKLLYLFQHLLLINQDKTNTIKSIRTFELLWKLTLMFRGCTLSAGLPRSTFTKYHLLFPQYPWWIKQVETPKSDDVNCSAKLTCSKKCSYLYCNVDCNIIWPPTATSTFNSERGEVVAGHVSKGDFHWLSPNPEHCTGAINGTGSIPVGCTIPDLIKAY